MKSDIEKHYKKEFFGLKEKLKGLIDMESKRRKEQCAEII